MHVGAGGQEWGCSESRGLRVCLNAGRTWAQSALALALWDWWPDPVLRAHGLPGSREDLGTEYARKLEELHREEQLINEEELEAEGLLQGDAPSVAADEASNGLTPAPSPLTLGSKP